MLELSVIICTLNEAASIGALIDEVDSALVGVSYEIIVVDDDSKDDTQRIVQDKARAIAVLRTMGATRGAIMRIFLITGATIGFVGTAVGLALGLLVAYNVEPIRKFLSWITGANLFPSEFYFLSQLPSRVEMTDVLSVVAIALILSLAATIYPSWRAAKLDPVEALRYE